MLADIAQEIEVVERVQPVGIVRHHGIAGAVAELQELREHLADAGQVPLDQLVGEDRAAIVLAGGVADARRSAAHQRDRTVAGLLHPVQHHDRHQRADMQ
jgi:hypothetical protein